VTGVGYRPVWVGSDSRVNLAHQLPIGVIADDDAKELAIRVRHVPRDDATATTDTDCGF